MQPAYSSDTLWQYPVQHYSTAVVRALTHYASITLQVLSVSVTLKLLVNAIVWMMNMCVFLLSYVAVETVILPTVTYIIQ